MNDNAEAIGPKSGDILPPDSGPLSESSALGQTLIALVSSYTDRPDLLIAEIEKHDPGFVKRMNEASEAHASEERAARFYFGKTQAYVSLAVSAIAAVAVIAAVFFAIDKSAGFATILTLAVFYAVTQGGSFGFVKVIEAIKDMLPNRADKKE